MGKGQNFVVEHLFATQKGPGQAPVKKVLGWKVLGKTMAGELLPICVDVPAPDGSVV